MAEPVESEGSMAIDEKIAFAGQLETKLRTEITAESLDRVMRAVMEVLDGYDVRANAWESSRQDDLLSCYLSAMRVEGRSQKTLDRYEYALRKLIDFCGVPVRRITVYHMREWLAHEQGRGVQDSTLEGNREVYSAFFNWLHREGLIDKNPVANLGAIKCAKKKKRTFSEVDIDRLIGKCTASAGSVQNRAIIEFLMTTGCRISEVTALNRDQVDLRNLEVIVLGKGNKERVVYMSPVAGMVLTEYLAGRTDDNPALFIGCRGERLTADGIRVMLRKLAKAAGVENVHPHRFRRTLATNLNRRGMQVQEVAAILGHERLDTTMKYVVLNNEDIRNAYRRYAL